MDATFNHDSGTGGTCAILRDNSGVFVAASCSDISFVEDATTAEARGLRDGLLLANEVGCNRICVEADCLEVVEIKQGRGNSLGPAATIYEECSFPACNFISIVFSHCPREANIVAHGLAKLAKGPSCNSFLDKSPRELIPLLLNDVALVTTL